MADSERDGDARRVEGYEVLERVTAASGQGVVYRAVDADGQVVSLKVLERWAVGAHRVEEMHAALVRRRHPALGRQIDVFRAPGDDRVHVVAGWVEGDTLAARAPGAPVTHVLGWARQVAEALDYLHADLDPDGPLLHRDVKPSNIFLTNSRMVKLLDFGSSGTITSDGEAGIERNWATRAYASPQVLDGEMPQPHDDVFALGVTAWCLLSGEKPFGERDAMAARAEGLEPAPLPPDAHEQWPAVRRALEFEARERSQHARTFLQEFDARDDDSGSPAPNGSPTTVAYGAVVATLLASVVWFSVQGVGGPPSETQVALENAAAAVEAGRFVEPGGEDAWTWYSAALVSDPGNPQALNGLEDIAERYIASARQHADAGDAAAARADLDRARTASPDHFAIALVEDLIARQGRSLLLRARQAAGTDMQEAEALVAQAEELLPGDDPDLASVRAEIARQRTETRVDALLRQIDDRIIAERLTVPRGDSAVDLLRQAKALAPVDREITVAADRIMTALLFQAMFAISNGDLDAAEDYLATAKGMGKAHIALARAEYELAKARRAAVSAR